jgi:tripartite-type tricarboxylate transporter receptor subunit TctC
MGMNRIALLGICAGLALGSLSGANAQSADDRLTALAIQPLTSTPGELAAFVPAEIRKWAQVVKDAGITPQ